MRKETIIRIMVFILGAFAVPIYNLVMLWLDTFSVDANKKLLKLNAELANLERLINIQLAEMHGDDVGECEED